MRAEILTFGQTSQLIIETRLIKVIPYRNCEDYSQLLGTTFPYVFSYLALIGPSLGQSELKIWLMVKLPN